MAEFEDLKICTECGELCLYDGIKYICPVCKEEFKDEVGNPIKVRCRDCYPDGDLMQIPEVEARLIPNGEVKQVRSVGDVKNRIITFSIGMKMVCGKCFGSNVYWTRYMIQFEVNV